MKIILSQETDHGRKEEAVYISTVSGIFPFWTRGPAFSFCTEFQKFYSQPCQEEIVRNLLLIPLWCDRWCDYIKFSIEWIY